MHKRLMNIVGGIVLTRAATTSILGLSAKKAWAVIENLDSKTNYMNRFLLKIIVARSLDYEWAKIQLAQMDKEGR